MMMSPLARLRGLPDAAAQGFPPPQVPARRLLLLRRVFLHRHTTTTMTKSAASLTSFGVIKIHLKSPFSGRFA
jgi:hypothetical protein